MPGLDFIDEKLINDYRLEIKHLINNNPSQKNAFLQFIRQSLIKHFDQRIQLMYLFPFSTSPFPVILTNEHCKKIFQNANYNDMHIGNPVENSIPYLSEFMKKNYFKNCFAILPLLSKDFIWGSNLRGIIQLNKCLLEDLGFQVIPLPQIQFNKFISPNSIKTSYQQKMAKKQLLLIIKKFMKRNKI